jgi:hypothetical protein
MPNNKPPSGREKIPSAHDIAEELLKEVVTNAKGRILVDDDDTPVDNPSRHYPVEYSAPPEQQWIERRVGRGVLWAMKAIVVSALIFLGSAMGSVFWAWLIRK